MSALGKLVAVHYVDGRVVKGRTSDFKPNCDFFHVRTDAGALARVETAALKGVFFIRTPEGDPGHDQRNDFEARAGSEKKIWIDFVDGEALAGWSSAFASGGRGFFFTPTDPDSNLERVYAFRSAIRDLRVGPEAERAAEAARKRS
ncbi:MAG: DUF6982 domain-containing protein [Candidatus Eiseniibacteriota bacterium]